MNAALGELLSPAERTALPPFEVRVLPPEAFEGMFRKPQGHALTLPEGDGAVVYVSSEAPARTSMLHEAAHLRQLADPELAADVRLLAERNQLNWADKVTEERLLLLDVQRRLEIDVQERIIPVLEKDAQFAEDVGAAADELQTARDRLTELRDQAAQAREVTPEAATEMNAGVRRRLAWMDEEARLFGTRKVEARPVTTPEELRASARPISDSAVKLERGEKVFQLGNEWTKTTYTTSAIDGTVTGIADVEGGTVVTVTPGDGGKARNYIINSKTVSVKVKDSVKRTGASSDLGHETQRYRLVEVRKTGAEPRLREEVLDVDGQWVERGTSRNTRGTVLEEAAEIQVSRELTQSSAARSDPTSVRSWFRVKLPQERRGFDRVFVQFHGEGKDTTAVIRVLEVKDYSNSYVPLAEFTAITDNFEHNVGRLMGILKADATRLAANGDAEAARALNEAIDKMDVTVEIWLGPTTQMGTDETAKSSVMAALRQKVGAKGPNVRLAEGGPNRVLATVKDEALAARAAGAESPDRRGTVADSPVVLAPFAQVPGSEVHCPILRCTAAESGGPITWWRPRYPWPRWFVSTPPPTRSWAPRRRPTPPPRSRRRRAPGHGLMAMTTSWSRQ